MSGWNIVHAGRRLWAATKADAAKLAKMLADETGKPVTVRPAKAKPAARPKAKAAAKKPARRVMRRNPDPGMFMDVWRAMEGHRASRRTYGQATKAKRIAKSMRHRGGSPSETAARKTGKFAVDAANRKEAFTLYRASRSAADQLAREFSAAGYRVTVREA